MTSDRAQLENHFRDMSDQDLLVGAQSGGLTEFAQQLALAEIARRGLVPLETKAEVPVKPALGPLQICTRFLLPLDAEIFAARLEAEGITAHVMDSHTIYAAGAFLYSLARGGVRVMVPESQMADAQRVLAAFNAGEYAIDENFDPN